MNSINLILGFVFSIVGIAFGWSLNQISQWLRIKQEDRRNINHVLFNLLETYSLLLRSDVDFYIKVISEKVLEKIPVNVRNQQTDIRLNQFFSDFVKTQIQPKLGKEITEMKSNYNESIKILAKIFPFTAYRLSGKTSIFELFDILDKTITNMVNAEPNNKTQIREQTNKVMGIMKPSFFDEALGDLESSITKLASKIGPITWWRAKKELLRIKKSKRMDVYDEADKYLAQMNPLFNVIPNPNSA